MEGWTEWSATRFFYLFIGLAYVLVWAQVTLLHWRGAFHFRPMWGPVVLSPLLAIQGILFAFLHGGWLDWAFPIVFALGALVGLLGTYYHIRGVRYYIGGFTLRNLIAGPPVLLPIVFLALSAAALLVFFLWGKS